MTATGTVGPRRVCVALRRLKRRGGLVFVTGPDGPAAERALQRLLGASAADRRRLLVSAGDDEVRVAGDVDDVRVVDRLADDRPADEGADLRSLRAELIDAIAGFETEAGGLAPGELRVVVDAVDPMVTAWGVERVDRFLRTVAALARGVRGLVGVRLRDPDALRGDDGDRADADDAPDRHTGSDRQDRPKPGDAAGGDPAEAGDRSHGRGPERRPDRAPGQDGGRDQASGRGTVGHRGSADDRRSVGQPGDVDLRRSVGRRAPPGNRRPIDRNWPVDLSVPDRFRQTADAWIEVCDCGGDEERDGDGTDDRDCKPGPAHRWHFPDVGSSAWVTL